MLERIRRDILGPVIRGMAAEGREYRGCLYAGLIMTPAGPKVIEFNCRFGDPETQVVLPLYGGDLARLLTEAALGRLTEETLSSSRLPVKGAAACVVLASEGYPDAYPSGRVIHGLEALEGRPGVIGFHAGTAVRGDAVVTAGGRVLGVTAVSGVDLADALRTAYLAAESVSFEGMHYRHDIGAKAIGGKPAPEDPVAHHSI
jgi:phosphoribosylamine--glycine ligase